MREPGSTSEDEKSKDPRIVPRAFILLALLLLPFLLYAAARSESRILMPVLLVAMAGLMLAAAWIG